MHKKHRLVTGLTIVIIALGIGTATTVFSVVDSVLIRKLPFQAPQELVSIELTTVTNQGRSLFGRVANISLFEAWRRSTSDSIDLAGFQAATATLSGDGHARTVPIVGITYNAIALLGVRPLAGRSFVEQDDAKGAPPCTILSYELSEQLFGSSSAALERHVTVNGRLHRIIGVMLPNFHIPLSTADSGNEVAEMWVPLSDFRELTSLSDDPTMPLEIIGRIRPGKSIANLEGRLSAVSASVSNEPEARGGSTVVQMNILQDVVVRSVQKPLLLVSGMVGLLLFLTSLNVANLLMARTLARDRELAVKIAIGASRGRLVAQLLAESITISLFGGLLGVTLAVFALPELVSLGTSFWVGIHAVGINARIVMFSLGLAVVSGAVVGAWPAAMALNRTPMEAITSRTPGGRRFTRNWKRALIALEVGLTVVVLTTMGLLGRSFARLTHTNRGYDIGNTIAAALVLPDRDYSTDEARRAFAVRLLDELKRQPAITDVAVSSGIPMIGGTIGVVSSSDSALGGNGKQMAIWSVAGQYFVGLGIPILRGREPDFVANPNGVAIDRAAARLLFGDENVVGRRLVWANGKRDGIVRAVVGDINDFYVIGTTNTRYRRVGPHVYVSAVNNISPFVRISARIQGDPHQALSAVREVVTNIDHNLPIDVLDTMKAMVHLQFARERFLVVIMALFAAMAGTLAGAGIFAVMAHATTERRHEIGIRLAMGARPSGILLLILGDAFILTGAGVTLGIAGVFSLNRVLRSVLFETAPFDVATLIGVVVGAAAISLVASTLPARRAAQVDAAAVLLSDL